MKPFMKNKTLMLLTSCLLIGCATSGRKIETSQAEKLKPGETTKEEVLRLLGAPQYQTRDSDGAETLTYSFTRTTVKPATFIPYVGGFVGGADTHSEVFSITLTNNIVQKTGMGTGADSVNMNLAAQGGKPVGSPPAGKVGKR